MFETSAATRRLRNALAAGAAAWAFASALCAQGECGGSPPSAEYSFDDEIPTITLESVGPELRFVDLSKESGLSLESGGTWNEIDDGGRVWRARILAPGALSMLVTFSRFQLPEGASLFAYSDDRTQMRGAYTQLNHRLDGTFAMGNVSAESLILEYFEPADAMPARDLHVGGILVHADKNAGRLPSQVPRRGRSKDAAACNVDVACLADENWHYISNSVVAIAVRSQLCSGVLINNTANDGTPYVVTAEHCGDLTSASFRFNNKVERCGEGAVRRTSDYVGGSTRVWADDILDLQIVRLNYMPPAEFGVVYAGWDRRGVRPMGVRCLHHPGGDVMKISVDEQAPTRSTTFWKIGKWETGTTEGGSSGAPLFDSHRRFIGQLKGGPGSCIRPAGDLFGRFDMDWYVLEEFLDPLGLGVKTLDSFDPSRSPIAFELTGLEPAAIAPDTRVLGLIGSGFGPAARVTIDDVKLPARNVRWVTNSRMEVDLPELVPGIHSLVLSAGDESEAIEFSLAPPED